MVRSNKNSQKLHKSCLYTGSGWQWGGERVVRLQGACLGGRGEDRSWQATQEPGRVVKERTAGPPGFRRRGWGRFPEGGPGRQSSGETVEAQTAWEYSYPAKPGAGGGEDVLIAEMPRYLTVAVRSRVQQVSRTVWYKQPPGKHTGTGAAITMKRTQWLSWIEKGPKGQKGPQRTKSSGESDCSAD